MTKNTLTHTKFTEYYSKDYIVKVWAKAERLQSLIMEPVVSEYILGI